MKKLSKKWIIIPSILLVIIGITLSLILFVFNGNNEHTYVAYVDINPLIKLNFKVSCDKDNNCSNPIVSDYELINEDAKTIYKDLVIKDKPLKETIELLANTVKDKDIVFKEIHIYSNYDNEEEFKVESTDYNITFDVKTDNDLEQFIDELVVKKENAITKEVLVPLLWTVPDEMKNQDMSSLDTLVFEPFVAEDITKFDDGKTLSKISGIFEVLNSEGFYTSTMCSAGDFESDSNKDIEVNVLRITISGPSEIIDTIPDKICSFTNDYIEAMLNITDITIGEHIVPVSITSKHPDISIISPKSVKAKYKVLRLGDANVSYFMPAN